MALVLPDLLVDSLVGSARIPKEKGPNGSSDFLISDYACIIFNLTHIGKRYREPLYPQFNPQRSQPLAIALRFSLRPAWLSDPIHEFRYRLLKRRIVLIFFESDDPESNT